MTTIAWRDGVLAADTLFTDGGARCDYGPKIFRVGAALVGFCGSRAMGLRFRQWVAEGMRGESPYQGEAVGNGFVATARGVVA